MSRHPWRWRRGWGYLSSGRGSRRGCVGPQRRSELPLVSASGVLPLRRPWQLLACGLWSQRARRRSSRTAAPHVRVATLGQGPRTIRSRKRSPWRWRWPTPWRRCAGRRGRASSSTPATASTRGTGTASWPPRPAWPGRLVRHPGVPQAAPRLHVELVRAVEPVAGVRLVVATGLALPQPGEVGADVAVVVGQVTVLAGLPSLLRGRLCEDQGAADELDGRVRAGELATEGRHQPDPVTQPTPFTFTARPGGSAQRSAPP